MTSTQYYKNHFSDDLKSIMATLKDKNVVSIHFLISQGNKSSTRRAFLSIKSKPLFLFCFFYTVLIDQVIHSSLNHEHGNFERIAGYPKFVGILSSYNSNMDPALLLLIATTYLEGANKDELTQDFKELSEFLLADYISFFHNVFPSYSRTLQYEDAQDKAIKVIFEDIANSMRWEHVSKEAPLIKPDLSLYKRWIDILNDQINKKLLEMH